MGIKERINDLTRLELDKVSAGLQRSIPTRLARSLADEDVWQWMSTRDFRLVLFDAEGTLVKTGGWDIDPGIKERLEAYRQDFSSRHPGEEARFGIVTNKRPKNWIDWVKIVNWNHQIGSDISLVPLYPWQKKPNPDMLLEAAYLFDVPPQFAVYSGDKASADIAAANAAGMWSLWVKRLGNEDLLGDRLGRRPPEYLLRLILENRPDLLLDKPPQSLAAETLFSRGAKVAKDVTSDSWDPSIIPEELFSLSNVISGYGAPTMLWDQIITDEMPFSARRQILQSSVYRKLDKILEENGDIIAKYLTNSRYPLSVVCAGLILAEKYDAALAVYSAMIATDFADGKAARRHKLGIKKKGGDDDNRADKFATAVIGLALAFKGRKSWEDFIVQIVSDREMNSVVRPLFEELGVETRSLPSGKAAMVGLDFAEGYSISQRSDRHPDRRATFQRLATIAKSARVAHAPIGFLQRDEFMRAEEEKARTVLDQLRDNPYILEY